MLFTYTAALQASATMVACDSAAILVSPIPSGPRSYRVTVPFSLRVYNAFLVSSKTICSRGSSSYRAALTNPGTRKERDEVEWLTFEKITLGKVQENHSSTFNTIASLELGVL